MDTPVTPRPSEASLAIVRRPASRPRGGGTPIREAEGELQQTPPARRQTSKHHEPDSKVVLRRNPHHAAAVNIAGTVVAFRGGAEFAGCDLLGVEYTDVLEGRVFVRSFGTANLSTGDPAALLEMEERHQAQAADLRRLAQEEAR